MNNVDLINACFEAGGAVLLWFNIRRLIRDKTVQCISLIPTTWWTVWGFWNVYFYYRVNTFLSLFCGVGIVISNLIWLSLALYYKNVKYKRLS